VASYPLALVVSLIALAVSVGALAFTGWQAVTAHLARTTPLPARFTLIHPQQFHEVVQVHNSGGSAASELRITIVRPRARADLRTHRVHVRGVIGAGSTVPALERKDGNPFVVDLFVPHPDEPAKWIKATEPSPDAEHLVEKWAKVEWVDWRGKHKRGRIALW
jgi:hypothetical protein